MLQMLFEGNAAVFAVPALIGTAVFVLQMLFLMLGGDHGLLHHVGVDASGADGHNADAGFKIISFQAIVAFAMGFGWVGLGAINGSDWSITFSVLAAIVGGVGMVWFMGLLMKGIYDLQTSGNIPLTSTLMHEGTVYLTVPDQGRGRGQVTLTVQGRRRVYDAVAEHAALPTGTKVKVVGVNEDQTLTVARA